MNAGLTPEERADLARLLGRRDVLALATDTDATLIYLCDAHGIDV